MMMTDPDMKNIDDLLARSAAISVEPNDDLMARVMADAAALQPASHVVARQPKTLMQNLLDTIGGWPALGGLATAGVAGLWIGVAPPIALETIAAEFFGTVEQVDLMGGAYTFDEVFDG